MFSEQIKSLMELDIKAKRIPPAHVNEDIVGLVKRTINESYCDIGRMLSEGHDFPSDRDVFVTLDYYERFLHDAASVPELIASGCLLYSDTVMWSSKLVAKTKLSVNRKSGEVSLDDTISLGELPAKQILAILEAMSSTFGTPESSDH